MHDDPPLLAEHVRLQAERIPATIAYSCPDFDLSYGVLEEAVAAHAAGLAGAGIGRGDVVAVLGNACPEAGIAFLACCRVGALYLGLNPKYTAREIDYLVADAAPNLLLALPGQDDALTRPGACRVDELLDATAPDLVPDVASIDPDDPCALIYTSGSTGEPKGALLSQRGVVRGARMTLEHWYGLRSQMRTVAQNPINHAGWLVSECVAGLLAGGLLVCRERFDPAETLRLIERERLTLWHAFPAMIVMAMQTPEFETCDLSSLERIALGTSPPVQVLARLRERTGAVVCAGYGLTETSGGTLTATAADAGPDAVATTIGRPLPGVELRIEDGELLVRDPCVFLGYYNRPEATAAAIDAEGWLHTGDVVEQGADGNLRLAGRLREMYKSGGYNVYPTEIETAIATHDDVSAVAVVGAPDPKWDEIGIAFLRVREGAAVGVDELREHARERLANYKVPKRFVLVDELPRLANEKVDRMALRERAASLVEQSATERR